MEIKTNKQNIVNVLKEKRVINTDDNPKLSEISEIIKNILICNHFGQLRINSNLGHNGKWSIDNGLTWNDFNYEMKVEIGTYEIIFKESVGYKTPESQSITIETGILTEITANYIQYGGLTVNSNNAPSEAKWSINQTTWYNFGETISEIEPGTYTIYFKDVEGYSLPSNNSVEIISGEITTISANYAPLPATIQSEKTENAPSESGWSINNGTTYYNFGALISVNPGSYTIKFKNVEGYITPPAIEVELKAGEGIIIKDDKYIKNINIVVTGLSSQYSKYNTTYKLSQDGAYWYSDETPDDNYQERIYYGKHPGNGKLCWIFGDDTGSMNAFIYDKTTDPMSIINSNVEVWGSDGGRYYPVNIEIASGEADITKTYVYTVTGADDDNANGNYWEEGTYNTHPEYTNGTYWLSFAAGIKNWAFYVNNEHASYTYCKKPSSDNSTPHR